MSSFLGGQTPIRVVSPAEALAAASQPGADVELTAGMTLEEATGVASAAADGMITTGTEGIDATEAACWYTTIWGEWGIYPYQQRVDDNTYWCGRGGILTYRNTYPTLGGTLCNHGDGASAAASAPPTCSSKSGDGVDLGSKYPRPLWQ